MGICPQVPLLWALLGTNFRFWSFQQHVSELVLPFFALVGPLCTNKCSDTLWAHSGPRGGKTLKISCLSKCLNLFFLKTRINFWTNAKKTSSIFQQEPVLCLFEIRELRYFCKSCDFQQNFWNFWKLINLNWWIKPHWLGWPTGPTFWVLGTP